LADAFKKEVYRLLRESAAADADYRFRNQLRAAAASVAMNIGEGFYRNNTGDFVRFLSIALASLGEASLWLHDGVEREYFNREGCANAWALANRCRAAMIRLKRSLVPFARASRPRHTIRRT